MFYLHVPKTGGQTLAVRLASAFDLDKVHLFQPELKYPHDVARFAQLCGSKEFIESHVDGELLQNVNDLQILCTVREPVAQIVSNWAHIRREPANIWHRAANTLRPGDFFDAMERYFVNRQTSYIISAFVPLRDRVAQAGHIRALAENFLNCLDRIKWLVPTESIDEFVDCWEFETKRLVPNRSAKLNVANYSVSEREEVRAAVVARPHLFAYDRVLHQAAVERFADYKRAVRETVAPWSFPDDSRRAYFDDPSGVWLVENWFDPELGGGGGGTKAWWAGPKTVSEVRFRRAHGEKVLNFYVRVVNGVSYGDIKAKTKRGWLDLPTQWVKTPREDGAHFTVALDALEATDSLVLVVNACLPSIVTTSDDRDLTPRSFLATGWQLL